MTPSPQPQKQNLSTQWNAARRLYPIYFQLAREFVIDVQPCGDLEGGVDTPGREAVEQAQKWLEEMDQRIHVHQLRQFLQTSPLANEEGLLNLIQHFLAKTTRNDAVRDKIDFLLVQYFSQVAPSGLNDDDVDLAYVAQTLEPVLGKAELKTPVWLNALDRVLESVRRCRSLDEVLHGGVLAQGRKAKTQAGELFYLPIALVAFTRFGYLMRRSFFHLMHGDLNAILDGLNELEERKILTIDCRRAQFSAQEPIARLRMICQSWKVMFQAEYSSGSPLRMLVDLRVSIDDALGHGKSATAGAKAPGQTKAPAAASRPQVAPQPRAAAPSALLAKAAAVGGASAAGTVKMATKPAAFQKPTGKFAPAISDTPEFDVASTSDWDPDAQPGKKK
jgi:hypothetical protein